LAFCASTASKFSKYSDTVMERTRGVVWYTETNEGFNLNREQFP